jgi:hypothetical protein
MAETSNEIRKDIEETRERMGDTVGALAYKADVPTRTKEWVGEKKDALTSKLHGATSKVHEATPDGEQVKRQVNVVKDTAVRNPLGLAIGGAAVGFLAGVLLPSTRVEDERVGPVADDLKSTAVDAGKEALERGKQVAQEASETALDTAKQRGREQGEELSASLQGKARSAVSSEERVQSPAQPADT